MEQASTTIDLAAAFTDHDRLFKELLKTFFLDFIALFLPELARYLDADSIVFLNTEVYGNVATGEKHVVDILARAQVRGEEAFFLLHVETQARAQPDFPERMFHYFADLSKTYRLPVYPIALLTFDRPLRAQPSEYRVTFGEFEPLRFQYRVIQLNRLNWRDFLNHPNPVAAALMAKMSIARKDRPKVKSECLRLLAILRLDPARTQLISGFIDSYLKLSAREMQEFVREIESLPREEQETIMPLTISWKEEGRVEGRVEGREEGLVEGLVVGRVEGRVEEARRLLVLAGAKRLGTPSSQVERRINGIESIERLEKMFLIVSDAESWDDLLASA